jgi:transcriptional regulator with PAS, ATPase and Fis domain
MYGLDQILGNSDSIKKVRDFIHRVANSPSNVLITGERGTGKELVAKVIHDLSQRRTASFVPVICSTISEAVWEGELFREANNGTLFLGEIGELPPLLQSKLIQTIEDKKIHRTGSARPIIVDVRVIASTSLNLENAIKVKRFRDDLYYRLNVVQIDLPPLRDRRKDVPALAEEFLNRYSQEHAKPVGAISEAALYLLVNYSWPGNVQELESVIERAVALMRGDKIESEDLPQAMRGDSDDRHMIEEAAEESRTLAEVERSYILRVLERTHGNKYKASEILGIDRKTLYRKLADIENEGVSE